MSKRKMSLHAALAIVLNLAEMQHSDDMDADIFNDELDDQAVALETVGDFWRDESKKL